MSAEGPDPLVPIDAPAEAVAEGGVPGAAGASSGAGAAGASSGAGAAGPLATIGGALGPNGLVAVAAGALVGLVGMAGLIGTGIVAVHGPAPVGTATKALPLISCAGEGAVVAMADPGVKMLFTGRSPDGAWLQVFVPGPAIPYGWTPIAAVHVEGDPRSLPVVACDEVAEASPAGSVEPSVAPPSEVPSDVPSGVPTAAPSKATGGGGSGTTKPTPTPTVTHKPTPTPIAGPTFGSAPKKSVPTIFGDASGEGDCWGLPDRVKFTVAISDTDPITGVELWWKRPTDAAFVKSFHTFVQSGGLWTTTVRSYFDHINAGGTLAIYAVATDAKGLKATSPTTTVAVRQCDTDATMTQFEVDLPTSGSTYVITCTEGPYYGDVPWYFAVTDPDGKAVAAQLTLTRITDGAPWSATVALNRSHLLTTHWSGTMQHVWYDMDATWTLVTTDPTGGTTTFSGTITFTGDITCGT